MATLDEISKERQRVSEALARVDAQREKLVGQLGELEATERVLARYSKGPRARKVASARTPIAATKVAAPARSGGRPRTTAAKPAGGKHSSPSLSDQVLALASGKTQQEIAAACKGARPNHVGAAIPAQARRPHRRARRETLRHVADVWRPTPKVPAMKPPKPTERPRKGFSFRWD